MSAILIIVGILIVGFVAYTYLTSYRQDPSDPENKISRLGKEKYSPDMNPAAAWRQRIGAEARGNLATKLNVESSAVAEMYRSQTAAEENRLKYELTPQRVQLDTEKSQADHEAHLETQATRIAETQLHRKMLETADQLGLPYSVFEQILSKAKLDELEIKRLAAEKKIILEAGFIYQLRGFHQLMMMRKEIDSLLEEVDRIENDKKLSAKARARMIAEREADIETLRTRRNAERERLVQSDNRSQLGGGD
ncbi:MAG: hypothetical protein M3362_00180 [Acidobacteriota bacterium]|nr:hypothetical protein [Acidobacteriota bacterium]